MIDPAKLTAENGFVDGCVVQYRTHLGGGVGWFCLEGQFALDLKGMTRIRPLTGPMAIWNFAPEWADVLLTSGQGLYRFFTNEEWAKWSAMMFDGEHDILTTRPFWARSEK